MRKIKHWFGLPSASRRILLGAICLLAVLASLFVMAKPAAASTGINKQISFQGKVVNTDGTNVNNGSYTFVFKMYTASTCPGSGAVWTESKSVTVTNGVFQTNLGDTTTLPGSVDFNTDNIYLGVNFNSDGEMCPLIRLTAVPQAFNADNWDGLDGSGLTQGNVNVLASGIDESEVSGVITAVTAGNGLTGGATAGAATLDIGAGNGISVASDSVAVNNGDGLTFSGSALTLNLTSSGTTGATFSNSGLENGSAGLTLLKGCADGDTLAWSDTNSRWECTAAAGGGSSEAQVIFFSNPAATSF